MNDVIINDVIVDQVTSNAEVWQLSAHMHLKAKCPNYEKVIITISMKSYS